MSFYHSMTGEIRLTPDILAGSTNAAVGSGTTYTVTPGATPTAGNLLFISAGGAQSRALTTAPTGFNTIITASGTLSFTNYAFWRVADGTEPATWSIVWNGALAGGWNYVEIKDADNASPILNQVGVNSTSTTSLALPSFDASLKGMVITYISKSTTTSWTSDNGTANQGGAGQHKQSYKLYPAVDLGEVITWSGTLSGVNADAVILKGRPIN